jgi:hypothetical protein
MLLRLSNPRPERLTRTCGNDAATIPASKADPAAGPPLTHARSYLDRLQWQAPRGFRGFCSLILSHDTLQRGTPHPPGTPPPRGSPAPIGPRSQGGFLSSGPSHHLRSPNPCRKCVPSRRITSDRSSAGFLRMKAELKLWKITRVSLCMMFILPTAFSVALRCR